MCRLDPRGASILRGFEHGPFRTRGTSIVAEKGLVERVWTNIGRINKAHRNLTGTALPGLLAHDVRCFFRLFQNSALRVSLNKFGSLEHESLGGRGIGAQGRRRTNADERRPSSGRTDDSCREIVCNGAFVDLPQGMSPCPSPSLLRHRRHRRPRCHLHRQRRTARAAGLRAALLYVRAALGGAAL